MSKTQRFNCSVRLGKKTYPAGEPVPLGGKTGLPKDEVDRLTANFGPWKGAAAVDTGEPGADAAAMAALRQENETLMAELETAQKDHKALTADLDSVRKENKDLADELETAQKDNAVLAERVKELEEAAKKAD